MFSVGGVKILKYVGRGKKVQAATALRPDLYNKTIKTKTIRWHHYLRIYRFIIHRRQRTFIGTPIKSSQRTRKRVFAVDQFFSTYTIRIILEYIFICIKAKANDCFENGNEIKYVHLYTLKYSHKPKYIYIAPGVCFVYLSTIMP